MFAKPTIFDKINRNYIHPPPPPPPKSKMGKWRVLPSRDFILDLGGWGLLFHVILPKIVELIRVAHA